MDILTFKYDKNTIDNLYEKRIKSGDFEGALNVLRRNLNCSVCKSDTYARIAETYFSIRMYESAVDYWFKFLNCCQVSEFPRAYNGLGASFYKLNNKNIAGHYIQKQLSINNQRVYKYNDILMEFIENVSDIEKQYYLAYPYDKADFTMLLDKCRDYVTVGDYSTALKALEIIPETSRFYHKALIMKSVCYFITGNEQDALKNIDEAIKTDDTDAIAICNGISMFAQADNKAKVKELVKLLERNEIEDEEDLYKKVMVYCELGEHNKALEASEKYLLKNKYDINIIFMRGIMYFNLGDLKHSIKEFATAYHISLSPVSKYYYDAVCDIEKNFPKEEKLPEMIYSFDFPKAERDRRIKLIRKLLKNQDLIFSLSESDIESLSIYAEYCSSLTIQSGIIKIFIIYGGKLIEKYFKNYLISVTIFDTVKTEIVNYFAKSASPKKIGVVFGNIYKIIKIPLANFIGENSEIYLSAYSFAFSLLAPVENDLKPLLDSAYEIYYSLLTAGRTGELKEINTIAACMFMNSGIKAIKRKRDFAKFFNAKITDINNAQKIIDEVLNIKQLENEEKTVIKEKNTQNMDR